LLVEWTAGFSAKFGGESEAIPILQQCEAAIQAATKVLNALTIPLKIQDRCLDRRILPNGVQSHLAHFGKALSDGPPKQKGFPERDRLWVTKVTDYNRLLQEFVEDFKAEFGEYEEAQKVIADCEKVLDDFKVKLDQVIVPIQVQDWCLKKNQGGMSHTSQSLAFSKPEKLFCSLSSPTEKI
jgi:hypothetical protein